MGDKEIVAEAPPPAASDDIGEETQCIDHPYRNNAGGICAFCLQEKLGQLVSSSSVAPVQPKPDQNISSDASSSSNNVLALTRSKSVAPATAESPMKKSFWSFLYLNSSSSSSNNKRRSTSSIAGESAGDRDLNLNEEKPNAKLTLEPEAESHVSSVGRKVARSRSVGCGSRSFSGDFLGRIFTGLGDCTLRRVESHRESNIKAAAAAAHHRQQLDRDSEQRIKERVTCGRIFGGFGVISSSSSTYWLSTAGCNDGDDFDTRRSNTARASTSMVRDSRSRNRSWAWAFASPMRAFKPAATSKLGLGPPRHGS